jgi:hypothetical protein
MNKVKKPFSRLLAIKRKLYLWNHLFVAFGILAKHCIGSVGQRMAGGVKKVSKQRNSRFQVENLTIALRRRRGSRIMDADSAWEVLLRHPESHLRHSTTVDDPREYRTALNWLFRVSAARARTARRLAIGHCSINSSRAAAYAQLPRPT